MVRNLLWVWYHFLPSRDAKTCQQAEEAVLISCCCIWAEEWDREYHAQPPQDVRASCLPLVLSAEMLRASLHRFGVQNSVESFIAFWPCFVFSFDCVGSKANVWTAVFAARNGD